MTSVPPDGTQPGGFPSVPDAEATPGRHDEPPVDVSPDRVPDTGFELGADSRADLRLQVESLLLRREAATPETWARLGEDARSLLAEMLEDPSLRSQPALRHRVIATLGDLRVRRSVTSLGGILQNRSEDAVTRAHAANSLGRVGDRSAVEALAMTVSVRDDMVRRQVAMALGRIDDDAAVSHLLKLSADPSVAVAEVASDALRTWEDRLGTRLGARPAQTRQASPDEGIPPAPEKE
ncbi:MAG TPA: HEAT repeat domain-containing protein [Jiangellales bacterium]|nr:HEAT repeat domain-containing protein [Jiangellales bacterium]